MKPDTEARIHLDPRQDTVRVSCGTSVVAESRTAVELLERGYPSRLYIPRPDVAAGILRDSSKRTHCPFKGDARYYHLELGGETLTDAAWSYDDPLPEMAAIAGHLCFDHPRLALAAANR